MAPSSGSSWPPRAAKSKASGPSWHSESIPRPSRAKICRVRVTQTRASAHWNSVSAEPCRQVHNRLPRCATSTWRTEKQHLLVHCVFVFLMLTLWSRIQPSRKPASGIQSSLNRPITDKGTHAVRKKPLSKLNLLRQSSTNVLEEGREQVRQVCQQTLRTCIRRG